MRWRGLALAVPPGGVGPLAAHRPCLFAYKMPPDAKTLNSQSVIHEKFHSAIATEGEIRETESLCSGTLSGRGSAPGAISIDSTTIPIVVADSHDEEGVVI